MVMILSAIYLKDKAISKLSNMNITTCISPVKITRTRNVRIFFGGFNKTQLRTEGTENGDLGAVAP
jgi:hypothetical protein